MVTERQSDVKVFSVLTLPKVISLPNIENTPEDYEDYTVTWDKDINLTATENLSAKFIVSEDEAGYIEYGAVTNGQRQGFHARITPAMLNTGTVVSYEFPFLGHHYGNRLGRVNLLTRLLGGNGKEPRNVIPLPFNHSQLPKLDTLEKEIVAHVSTGNNVDLSVRVSYAHHPAYCALFPTVLIYVLKKIKGISSKIVEEKTFELPIYWPA